MRTSVFIGVAIGSALSTLATEEVIAAASFTAGAGVALFIQWAAS